MEEIKQIKFPIDFSGISKSGKKNIFANLSASSRLILAIIHTCNKPLTKPAKITFNDFSRSLRLSKETVLYSIRKLKKYGFIKIIEPSHYSIQARYNINDYTLITLQNKGIGRAKGNQ